MTGANAAPIPEEGRRQLERGAQGQAEGPRLDGVEVDVGHRRGASPCVLVGAVVLLRSTILSTSRFDPTVGTRRGPRLIPGE